MMTRMFKCQMIAQDKKNKESKKTEYIEKNTQI